MTCRNTKIVDNTRSGDSKGTETDVYVIITSVTSFYVLIMRAQMRC